MASVDDLLQEAAKLRQQASDAEAAQRVAIQEESDAILRAELEAEVARLRAVAGGSPAPLPPMPPAPIDEVGPPADPSNEKAGK